MNRANDFNRREFVLKAGLIAGAPLLLPRQVNATDASLTDPALAIADVDRGARQAITVFFINGVKLSGYRIIPEGLHVLSTPERLEAVAPLTDACTAPLDQLPDGIPVACLFLCPPPDSPLGLLGLPAGFYLVLISSDQPTSSGFTVPGIGKMVLVNRKARQGPAAVVAQLSAEITVPPVPLNLPVPKIGIAVDPEGAGVEHPVDRRYLTRCDGVRFSWDFNSIVDL